MILSSARNTSGQNYLDSVNQAAFIRALRQVVTVRAFLAWAFDQVPDVKIKFISFYRHELFLFQIKLTYHNQNFYIKNIRSLFAQLIDA